MYAYPETKKLFTKEIVEGIEFNWIKLRNYGTGKSIGRIFSMFEFAIKVLWIRSESLPDIIITPSVSMLPVWSIFFLKKVRWKNKPKVIFEIRDIWPLTLILLGKKSRGNLFIRLLSLTEKFAYHKADYIISTLHMCQQHIDTITKSNYRFKWIDNGINIPESSATLPDDIKALIPTNKFLVGYTGALGIANAMDSFIDAAKILQKNTSLHFVIVGDGYEKKSLMDMSRNMTNITFIPKVNKNIIPPILSLFDVLYFSFQNAPDLYKFGVSANKTYEYMLSAKPIILSCVDMDYNIIKDANCGLVIRPESPELIVEAINELYAMTEDQRMALGENGRKYILENNTFDILADKLIDVFHDLEV